MFKTVINGFKAIKKCITTLEKVLPKPVKKEFNTMYGGVNNLRTRIRQNYYIGRLSEEILGSNKFISVAKGVKSALTTTKITQNEIPSLCALTGLAAVPLPGGMEAGYVVGRLATSKPAMKALSTGKNIVTSGYSALNNLFRI
ncbi:MAG: hypothetical protein NC191_10485 [Muribaculaceae bacterium]|nr:hypothetical protein [Muribaculaceae bacterium]